MIPNAAIQDLLLLQRAGAIEKVNAVLDGQLNELCLKTRFPREVSPFVAACIAKRGEAERGVGERCFFVRDRESWLDISDSQTVPSILVADPALDFETHRSELLKQARLKNHRVIYGLTSPRPDIGEVVTLRQPSAYEVEEALRQHLPAGQAKSLAVESSGNTYLVIQLLSGTTERRRWASSEVGPLIRHLALLGGWVDSSAKDKAAIAQLVNESYEVWSSRLYPFTRQEEPPIVLEGIIFRAISRYELLQQLGPYLTNADLERLGEAAVKILSETEPRLELPKAQRQYASLKPEAAKEMCSPVLRRGVAETLALIAGQSSVLTTSAGLAASIAENTVRDLLTDADWKRWASLDGMFSFLAEAAPNVFLTQLDGELSKGEVSSIRLLFSETESPLFGRTYHAGLLWALEVLAWNKDYLGRVALCLARMVNFPLPENTANNALNSLRSIFLTWLPQTLAPLEYRVAAVKKVVEEYPDVGWRLLLLILPESHQTGSYNPKPIWSNWFDKSWTGEVTRHEMMRQVASYAQLAVQCAVQDVHRLDELIGRWNHLPREAVDEILNYLLEPGFAERPDEERFVVWERLVNEVLKHRNHPTADWAMPEEELHRLEDVAEAIAPRSAIVRYQRLFNEHDGLFFESDDYDKEHERLAKLRTDAVRAMLQQGGPETLLRVAKRVKRTSDLGGALGQIADAAIDRFLLPKYLLAEDERIRGFARGYVWARYFVAGAAWAENFEVADWSLEQKASFFADMPFQVAVWRRAERVLGDETGEYWKRIFPNPFQARDNLEEAVTKAIEYKRADIALSGVNAMRYLKQEVPIGLIVDAVKSFLDNYQKGMRFEHHELLEAIKLLQRSDAVDIEEVSRIEFQSLNLLDRLSGAAPVVLERRLANDPNFFHTMVTQAFRSENAQKTDKTEDDKGNQTAGHIFRLLYHWQTPPGTKGDVVDEELLRKWVAEAEELSRDSGHLKIAQQLIGTAFVYFPLGIEGLLKYPEAAKILERSEADDMRRGFVTGLFNLRGVHGYTAGKEEMEIAKSYHDFAEKFELSGFIRIATALRQLSESYWRDAEREAKENPYEPLS